MRHYFRMLKLFAQFSLMRQLAYRLSFAIGVFGKILRIGVLLLFFDFLYLRTSLLAGWRHEEVLVLSAIYLTIELLYSITFQRNLLYWFPQRLRKGSFDFLITKPINTLFHTAFKDIDFFDLFSSIPVVALWVYLFVTVGVSWKILPLVIFFMGVSLVFLFAVTLIIASLSFWTIQGSGIGRLTDHVMRVSRYPADVFHGGWRILFWYILPVGIIATLPAKIWFSVFDPWYTVYALFITLVLLIISFRFWHFGLRHYQSASS